MHGLPRSLRSSPPGKVGPCPKPLPHLTDLSMPGSSSTSAPHIVSVPCLKAALLKDSRTVPFRRIKSWAKQFCAAVVPKPLGLRVPYMLLKIWGHPKELLFL